MLLLLAALLAAQTPPATQPPVVVTGDQAKPKKPKQLCQMMEITGSRARHRVCHDANGYFDPVPGVSNYGGSRFKETHDNGVSGQPMGSVPSG
jgi:hypothetical protein